MPVSSNTVVANNRGTEMIRYSMIVTAVGVALCGCSSMNLQGELPADEPIYTTGSHLPSRSANANSVKTLAPPTIDQTMRGHVCVGGPCGANGTW